MMTNRKGILRMMANWKDILRMRLLEYCIPAKAHVSGFGTYQQVLGWLEVKDSSELVVGDVQVDQVGQGTQHTEALVCREETEHEVSVFVCVCGSGGVGVGVWEWGWETLASFPGSFLLKEKMSLGTRLGRPPGE